MAMAWAVIGWREWVNGPRFSIWVVLTREGEGCNVAEVRGAAGGRLVLAKLPSWAQLVAKACPIHQHSLTRANLEPTPTPPACAAISQPLQCSASMDACPLLTLAYQPLSICPVHPLFVAGSAAGSGRGYDRGTVGYDTREGALRRGGPAGEGAGWGGLGCAQGGPHWRLPEGPAGGGSRAHHPPPAPQGAAVPT